MKQKILFCADKSELNIEHWTSPGNNMNGCVRRDFVSVTMSNTR